MERNAGTFGARIVWSVWGVLAAGIVVAAAGGLVEPVGTFATKATIRLAMLFYGFSIGCQLLLERRPRLERVARDAWTVAWFTFAVHVACAFHYYHGWSHAHAFEHTAKVSGWGWGIYVSHVFNLSWGVDALLWRFAPEVRARRPAWLGRTLHGFWAFIVFNGMIVFETGVSQVIGVLIFGSAGAILLYLRLVPPTPAAARPVGEAAARPRPVDAATEAALQPGEPAVD